MRAVDIIRRKRDGRELDRDEIHFLVSGYTAGRIPDYQISAFLMAVTLVGVTERETHLLTELMLESGARLDLGDLPGEKIDKHSTGGVGDKTSLVIAPLAAAAGLVVPMISGRGLGHSGGTLDKLESIPGFDVHLSLARFRKALETVGCALIGQTEEIAPADRKLYALRDVTATIESVPLITASILSKKLAEGISGLVLDVKLGSGAFMKDAEAASRLAASLVRTARRMGTRSVAVLTDMNQPLGTHVGNALEVREAVEVLRGGGEADLRELCLTLTAHMLRLGKKAADLEDGKKKAEELIRSGAGLERFARIVEFQGGDPRVIEDPARLPSAERRKELAADRSGFLGAIDTEAAGRAAMLLGAGRERMEDPIDPAVGLVVHRKIGDPVSAGNALVTIHYSDASRLPRVENMLMDAFQIQDGPPAPQPLVHAVLDEENRRP